MSGGAPWDLDALDPSTPWFFNALGPFTSLVPSTPWPLQLPGHTQVSLHNSALINMDADPTGGFKKLNFLLQSPPFPPETFNNLLLL